MVSMGKTLTIVPLELSEKQDKTEKVKALGKGNKELL